MGCISAKIHQYLMDFGIISQDGGIAFKILVYFNGRLPGEIQAEYIGGPPCATKASSDQPTQQAIPLKEREGR